MVKLVVTQYWETSSYPFHNAYKVMVYRDNKFACTGQACDSKRETVAYIDGIMQVFRLYNEVCEIEYIDSEGEPGEYCDVFLLEHGHYLNN